MKWCNLQCWQAFSPTKLWTCDSFLTAEKSELCVASFFFSTTRFLNWYKKMGGNEMESERAKKTQEKDSCVKRWAWFTSPHQIFVNLIFWWFVQKNFLHRMLMLIKASTCIQKMAILWLRMRIEKNENALHIFLFYFWFRIEKVWNEATHLDFLKKYFSNSILNSCYRNCSHFLWTSKPLDSNGATFVNGIFKFHNLLFRIVATNIRILERVRTPQTWFRIRLSDRRSLGNCRKTL